MSGQATLLLGQADIARTMALSDYIDAVEQAFICLGAGQMAVPPVQHMPAPDGAFHVKSAGFLGDPYYVAVDFTRSAAETAERVTDDLVRDLRVTLAFDHVGASRDVRND